MMIAATDKAQTLLEALPFFQKFRGAIFVIKLGGSLMTDPATISAILKDIVLLEIAGIRPVIVHGGGKAISQAMQETNNTVQFIEGLRVTPAQAIPLIAETLQEINQQLVASVEQHGGSANGFLGQEVFQSEPIYIHQKGDLGSVGRVSSCYIDEIYNTVKQDRIPLITPLSATADNQLLNVNADLASVALAKQLGAEKLIYLSDVRGVLRDRKDSNTLIHSITPKQAENYITEKVIVDGMVPKIKSAVDAVQNGVHKVHFVDAKMQHGLLLEIFTPQGIGTEIIAEND